MVAWDSFKPEGHDRLDTPASCETMMHLQLNLSAHPPAAHSVKVWPFKEVVRDNLACLAALEYTPRGAPVLNIALAQNMLAGIFTQPGVSLSFEARRRADVLFSKGLYYAYGAMMAHAFHFDEKLIVEPNKRSHAPHHYTTPHYTTPHHTPG